MTRGAGDRLFQAATYLVAGLVAAVLLWILADMAWQGVGHLSWEFLTAAPEKSGRACDPGAVGSSRQSASINDCTPGLDSRCREMAAPHASMPAASRRRKSRASCAARIAADHVC